MGSSPCDHGTEDACFNGIYSYGFKDNQKFLEGWRKVQQAVPDDKLYDSLIKAQVFFYSREVISVDFAQYCTWLAKKQLKVRDFDYLIARVDREFTGKKPEDTEKDVNESVRLNTAKISYTPNANSTNIENNNASGGGEANTAVESANKTSIIDSDDARATLQGFNAEDNKNTEKFKSIDNRIEFSDDDNNISEVAKQPANFMELIEMIQSGMKLPDTEDLNIEPLNEDPTPCDISRPNKPWEVS